MSSRSSIPMLAVAGVVGILVGSPGLACQCGENPSIDAELSRSAEVFVGTVVDVHDEYSVFERISHRLVSLFGRPPILEDKEQYLEKMGFRVAFSVSESFKGGAPVRVEVLTGRANGDCGFVFEEGKSYLVYATRSGRGFLVTDSCTRTKASPRASAELIELRRTATEAPGPS